MNRCETERAHRLAVNKTSFITSDHPPFQRRIEFQIGYDHTTFPEVCGGGGHGQHGMTQRFILVGPLGATQFVINMPAWVPGRVKYGGVPSSISGIDSVTAHDLGYHSPHPMYEEQLQFDCDLLPNSHCYYDGSSLNAEPVLEKFLANGLQAVWDELTDYYCDRFDVKIIPETVDF